MGVCAASIMAMCVALGRLGDRVAILVGDSGSLDVELAIVVVAAGASLLALLFNSLLVREVLFGLAGWCLLGLLTCEHA